MLNKRCELSALILEHNPDVIGITEILAKNRTMTPEDQEFHIDGYTHYTNLEGRHKRGVILYLKSHLNANIRNIPGSEKFEESIWCEVSLKGSDNLLIGVVYRSPNCGNENHENLRALMRNASNIGTSHVLVMGDFNYSEINWVNGTTPNQLTNPATAFVETLRDLYYYQHITDPTHYRADQQPNTLDLVITNEEGMVDNVLLRAPVGKSHHLCITFDFMCYSEQPTKEMPRFQYHKGHYEEMRKEAQSLTWNGNGENRETTLEEKWHYFMNNMNHLMDKYIPKSRPRVQNGTRRPIYMTACARDKVRTKNKAFSTWRQTRSGHDYISYTKARNQAKWECRKAQRDFEMKLAKESKQNPKAFYKYAKSKLKTRPGISQLSRDDGSLTKTDTQKANILNDFFSSVFTKEDMVNIPDDFTKRTDSTISDIALSKEDIEKKLSKLNPNKSTGPDGAAPRILKELYRELSDPLYDMYRQSLDTGKLPTSWKTGLVSPIFKKGNRHQAKNYRPVSLTSVVCKTLESIIRDHLMHHLVENHLLSQHQHGFIKGRSCVTQLLAVLDKWTEALDRCSNLDAIYLDFSKAFDSVPHHRLLMKLEGYGISGSVWSWIEDFLVLRNQRVIINGMKSKPAWVLSGIPQGSVLGPLLFILFVNDMPETVQSHIQMFADDTKIFREVNNPAESLLLQTDIEILEKWSSTWQLKFNAEKCKVMHLGTKNSKHQYIMHNEGIEITVQQTELEKDLGVFVDPKLTFSSHCEQKANKANKILGLIRRSYVHLDATTVKCLYTSLVRPHLEYGHAAWCPVYKKDSELLENTQRRATKLVPALKDLSYTERLERLDLPSLYYRRARGDVIEAYKHMHNKYTVDANYIKLDESNTRGHKYKIKKERTSKNIRQQFFSNRIANTWNMLPADIVEAPSLNALKARLDKYWRQYKYSQHSVHDAYNPTKSNLDKPRPDTGF